MIHSFASPSAGIFHLTMLILSGEWDEGNISEMTICESGGDFSSERLARRSRDFPALNRSHHDLFFYTTPTSLPHDER